MVERLKRLPDWRQRLSEALAPMYTEPFKWNKHDCATGLGCIVVEALTGVDLRKDWPSYSTELGAYKALRKRGFETLADAVGSILPEAPLLHARQGDIALIRSYGLLGHSIGLVNPSTILTVTESGLGHVPREEADKIFLVG